MARKIICDINLISHLYYDEQKSLNQIAKAIGVSQSLVHVEMIRHGLKRRTSVAGLQFTNVRPTICNGTIESPIIGDTRRGKEVGFPKCLGVMMWAECSACGKQRWVRTTGKNGLYIVKNKLCQRCASTVKGRPHLSGTKHPMWKGGRSLTEDGYIRITLEKTDFFYAMENGHNYILEHRLIMAKALGRCLQNWEVVHHKNGIKSDNRIENLTLMTRGNHSTDHNKGYQDGYLKGYNDGRNALINKLKREIISLNSQLNKAN